MGLFKTEDPDSFVKNYETHIVVENGKIHVTKHLVIQINNQSGTNSSEVTIYFDKDEPIKGLKAEIQDIQGNTIKKLVKTDIHERNLISSMVSFDDRHVQEFALYHNVYPYILEYIYTTTEREFITIGDWNYAKCTIPTVRN